MEYKTIEKYDTLLGHFGRALEKHELMHPEAYNLGMNEVEKHFNVDNPDMKFNPNQHLKQYKEVFVDKVIDMYSNKAKEFFHHPDIEKADLDRLVQVYTDQSKEGLSSFLEKNKYQISVGTFQAHTSNNVERFKREIGPSLQQMTDDTIVQEVIDKYKLTEHSQWDVYKERFDKQKAIVYHQSQKSVENNKQSLDQIMGLR
jgi:hypothetical protein